MIITKFNKLIRNKLLWAFFAVFVCISFVGLFTGKGGCSIRRGRATGDDEGGQAEFKLYRKVVTQEDVAGSEFNTWMGIEMRFGRRVRMSDAIRGEVRKESMRRLAALRTADSLGIGTTDQEVGEAIKGSSDFSDNGTFSIDRYNTFIDRVLGEMSVRPRQFEEYVRDRMTLEKLGQVAAAVSWVAPSEINASVSDLSDVYSVECALLSATNIEKQVTVSTNDAGRYYAEHKDQFKVPAKTAVRYVAWPVTNFLAAAAVTDDAARDYYDEHNDEFSAVSTNGTSVVRPFEEVKDRVREKLARKRAAELAEDRATSFVMKLAPDRAGKAASFDDAAKAEGLAVRRTDFFSADQVVTQLNVSIEFTRKAFDLKKDDPDAYFSDPVQGADHVYVLAFGDRTEAFVPEFRDIVDKVMAPATRAAVRDRLKARASELRADAAARLKEGKTFADAAKAAGLTSTNLPPFAPYAPPETMKYGRAVAAAASGRLAGELLDVVSVAEGALIARVADRKQGDPISAAAVRRQMEERASRYRASLTQTEWNDRILAAAGKPIVKEPEVPFPEPGEEE